MAKPKTKPAPKVVPATKIETWAIERLTPYARNARTHSEDQVRAIARSIERFGFTNPILVDDDGSIIAGHGRLLGAKLLGRTEVPVIVCSGWTDEERRAYIIADNQLALQAGWDEDLLRIELGELRDLGFDLDLTGFDAAGIAAILDVRPDGATDPEEASEPPAVPVATRGDLWALGRHRLLCGDATSAEDTARLLDGAAPHLMVTDPPYGVEYDANWRNERVRADGFPSDGRAIGKVANDDQADWRKAWDLFAGDVAYVWHAGLRARQVVESLEASRFEMRAQIIWSKGRFAIGRGDYHFQHEPCWYAVRKGKTGHWAGDRKQTTLWQIDKPHKSETGHSTQKPVECMKRPIENNSSPGQAVYEPFSGSGTTIIAAEMTGRACHAIEISPAYVDVAVLRWQAFTGQTAALEGDGRSFDEIAEQRRDAA